MAIFLSCAVPLSLLILVGVYFPRERENRSYLKHGLYGLLLSVPVLLIHSILKAPLPKSFLYRDLFINVFVYRTFQLFILGLFVYHIPFGFSQERRDNKFSASLEWQTLLFFGVFYSAASLVDAVLSFGDYHFTLLFYIPLSRIGIMCATTAALAFSDHETGIRKVILYIASLVVPLLITIGYPLFFLKMYGLAIPVAIIAVGGSIASFHFWMQKQYEPGSGKKLIPLRAR